MANSVSDTTRHSARNSVSRGRCWVFTINNPLEEDVTQLTQVFLRCEDYRCQEEVGKNGTPHIQGYIYLKNARSLPQVSKMLPRAHLEKAVKPFAARQYCAKIDSRMPGGRVWEPVAEDAEEVLDDYFDVSTLTWWQVEIFNLLQTKPVPRKIYWYWSSVGNIGKTQLARHVCMGDPQALYVGGKAVDIKFAVTQLKLTSGKSPSVVFINYSKTQEEYVSYASLEQLTDGIFFSSKYESRSVIFNVPHVICFANFFPNKSAVMLDRWYIRCVG